jgi:tetratricopeptide (TPR) repeat protein
MKSEHRHELQTNDLSKALMTFPDYAREYGGRIALGLAIVVLAIVLIMQRLNHSHVEAQRQRDELAFARSVIQRLENATVTFQGTTTFDPTSPAVTDAARRLRDIRENASDKAVLAQATLAEGDLAWARANFPDVSAAATQPVPKPEKDRSELLTDAKNAYQAVLSQFPDQRIPVLAARFGLAAIAENARDWDEARKHYEAVKTSLDAIDSYRRLAEIRLKALDDLQHPVLIGQVAEKLELPPLPTQPTTAPATAPAARSATTKPTGATTRPTK